MKKTLMIFLLLFGSAVVAFGLQIYDLPTIEIESPGEYILPVEVFLKDEKSGHLNITFSEGSIVKPRFDKKLNAVVFSVPNAAEGLEKLNMRASAGDETVEANILSRVKKSRKMTLKYRPQEAVKKVFLAGDFNSWNSNNLPLLGPDKNGDYFIELKLSPGAYKYKFVVDGNWLSDPLNPESVPDGFGGKNSVLKIGTASTGKWHTVSRQAGKIVLKYIIDENMTPINPATLKIAAAGNNIITNQNYNFSAASHELVIKDSHNSKAIRVNAMDLSGNILPEFVVREPDAWRDGTIYFAFTDRFFNGDKSNDMPSPDTSVEAAANYQGGDFRGIIGKINDGYFKNLGVNVLWISPVVENPNGAFVDALPPHKKFTGYHGYWPVSFWKVDKRYGSMEELKELVATAHKNGMKVIFDMVLNHVHQENELYKKNPEWFSKLELPDGRKNIRLFDERPYDTWFDQFLPDIDYENNPAAVRYMVDNCIWWIKETNCDGFRLDAVKHMPMEFWIELRKRVRQEIEIPQKKMFYLVGETISSREKIMEFVGYDKLDGQFDFPIYWAIKDVFAWESRGFDTLEEERKQSDSQYSGSLMSPLLGNHDFARFTAFADGAIPPGTDEKARTWQNRPEITNPETYKKLKLAFTFLLTQAGVPMIYYGDEIGLTGAGDPDNRRMMKFDAQLSRHEKELLEYVSRLNKFRHDSKAVRYGEHHTLLVGKDIYAYLKNYFGEVAIVILNKSDKSERLSLMLPEFVKVRKLKDVFTNRRVELNNLKIPPRTAMILRGGG